jgi:hypothetical protein
MILSFFEGAEPRHVGCQRRMAVIGLGVVLATVTCSVIGIAFAQSTSWHSYGTDRPLAPAARARVEAIRDEVDASGIAPEAVTWLDAALGTNVDPTTVRTYLLTAHETLSATGTPELAGAARELRAIIQTIRSASPGETPIPRSMPTLEWPW